MMIAAVTFDLWNTLLREKDYGEHRISVLAEILDEEGYSRDRSSITAEYASTIDFFFEVWMKEQKHLPTVKLTDFILKRLGVRLPAEVRKRLAKQFEEVIFENPPPLTENAKTVLQSLHTRYRIGLISNSGVTPGRNLRRILEQHAILRHFWCTVFSDEVGYHKPHPAIFRRAIRELQMEAHEVIHVGDFPESDVAGAKAVGMKTMWFNKDRDKCQRRGVAPDYEIGDLAEILEILRF